LAISFARLAGNNGSTYFSSATSGVAGCAAAQKRVAAPASSTAMTAIRTLASAVTVPLLAEHNRNPPLAVERLQDVEAARDNVRPASPLRSPTATQQRFRGLSRSAGLEVLLASRSPARPRWPPRLAESR